MSAAMLTVIATGCQNEVLVEESQPREGRMFTLKIDKNIDSRTVLGGNNET